jgi:hypothetical protein
MSEPLTDGNADAYDPPTVERLGALDELSIASDSTIPDPTPGSV